MNPEYKIHVTFFRNLGDDADVIGKSKPTNSQLAQQFRKELQEAYKLSAMAGRFKIGIIET